MKIFKSMDVKYMEEDEIKNFEEAISHLTPWIKEKIGESKDKTIRVKAVDFLGDIDSRLVDKERKDCVSLYDQTIYDQTKDVLSKEGIWVTLGFSKSYDTLYVMRLLSDKKEFITRQIQEAEAEINKLKEHIQTGSIDQLPDDVIEYLGEKVVY